jgi:hypothetical protein
MQPIKGMTMEQIDSHIADHQHLLAAVPGADKTVNLCGIYSVARPAMVFLESLLGFFKPSWATVLQALVTSLDAACSITPTSL